MLLSKIVDFSIGSKQYMPLFVGFCVGISLCLIFTNNSVINETCNSSNTQPLFSYALEKDSFLPSDVIPMDVQENYPEDSNDYDPRINLDGKPHSAKKEPHILVRPRYYSTELGIKERSFVAVLSSIKQISSLGLAINQTLAHHVNRLAFFVDVAHNKEEKLDVKALQIVGFKDSQQGLLTLHTLKYLADKLAVGYSYFFFIRDTTYVDGRKLDRLVKNLSITEHVYMGTPGTGPTDIPSICSLDSGILISSSVLLAISPLLESCTEEFTFNSDDEKIGLCIHKVLNITCQPQFQDQSFTSFNLDEHTSTVLDVEKLWDSNPELSLALTSYHARDPSYFFMLNKLSCAAALKEVNLAIQQLEQSILKSAPSTPAGLDSLVWPIGYSPPTKPETRFSVLRWDYFNETHIFFDTEHSVVRPLIGAHLEDIKEVIQAAVADVMENNAHLKYVRLMDGYRRFDPTRGMDYKLHLLFHDPIEGEIIQRMEGCRPITHLDTVPMPYVTESSLVNIIVALSDTTEVEAATKFVQSYAKSWMAKSDKSELTLVLPASHQEAFGSLKTLAQTLSSQYRKQGGKIRTVSYEKQPNEAVSLDFIAVDLVSHRLGPDSLVFLCSPFTEIYPDVLNRVRINTISGWQLFSAIPFSEYNPDVSFPSLPRNQALNISTNQGFYDANDSHHISFYLVDYLNARKTLEQDQEAVNQSVGILNMFVQFGRLHILRAVEPHLRVRYHERKCWTRQCRNSVLLSQGTRSELAQFALDREVSSVTT